MFDCVLVCLIVATNVILSHLSLKIARFVCFIFWNVFSVKRFTENCAFKKTTSVMRRLSNTKQKEDE
jgi:hypothetical protein